MGVINALFQKIEKNRHEGESICSEIDEYLSYVDQVLFSKNQFIDAAFSDEVLMRCGKLKSVMDGVGFGTSFLVPELRTKKAKLSDLIENISVRIAAHNDEVASVLAVKARGLIGTIEGRSLDEQQMKCIVKPVSNHLVIAGAGTGKTTTIVGRVKYLLKSGACEAKDILVLSFTNASASEMRNRINKETGEDIAASTFHKLGINIIKEVEGIAPKITQIKLQKYARDQLMLNMKDPKYLGMLCNYFLFNPKYDRSEFDFKTSEEYDEYLRTNPPVTLKGDRVKSYGEMDIANYLFSNGIEYEYEKEYEVDTRTADRSQYYPDFHLTESGCYIEYFGINSKGEVPPYFSSRDGKSPSEVYRAGMEWKRNVHKENNTVLIECYSYERSRGELLSSLEEKLKKQGVKFRPLSSEEVWKKVEESNSKNVLNGIAELMSTIITLMKSNELNPDQLMERCIQNPKIRNNTVLVNLVEPIYKAYVSTLDQNGEIDFTDMISKAAHMAQDGRYVNPYKYVIVDEYQDISRSRFNLLKALRDSSDYRLFCVGDDWQSIYRFAGSDMDYFLNFSKYWGPTEYSKIETTYRFTESLVDISGIFVMQNPTQIKKNLKGAPSKFGFAMDEIKGRTDEAVIKSMLKTLRKLPDKSSVFFIGRYTYDSYLLSNCSELDCKYDLATQTAHVYLHDRRDLKMEFITAHKSKGLQADYVFIINNKDRGMGFPSKIQDDPIVDSLLQVKEEYPFAEERRLFYVALTRAKKKSYLLVVNGNESAFASEMEKRYSELLKNEEFTCPLCGGYLVKKSGPYGEFYGCSNYRMTGCSYKKKIYKKHDLEGRKQICPKT